jgi:hypothetical protein
MSGLGERGTGVTGMGVADMGVAGKRALEQPILAAATLAGSDDASAQSSPDSKQYPHPTRFAVPNGDEKGPHPAGEPV